jgi:hypothetical protein
MSESTTENPFCCRTHKSNPNQEIRKGRQGDIWRNFWIQETKVIIALNLRKVQLVN